MPPKHVSFVPLAADLPSGTDLALIRSDLADDHVALVGDAADADKERELAHIVKDARARGVSLSIVVIDGNPRHDSQLRDLATEVGKAEHGTVLVLSADWAGTYSDSVSRVRLEAGEDAAKSTAHKTVVSANNFVNAVTHDPVPSPTVVTSVMVVVTAVLTGALYLIKARRPVKPVAPSSASAN